MVFDHILTLTDEIQAIWLTRCTMATVIFLVNRYLALVGYIAATYIAGIATERSSPYYVQVGRLLKFSVLN